MKLSLLIFNMLPTESCQQILWSSKSNLLLLHICTWSLCKGLVHYIRNTQHKLVAMLQSFWELKHRLLNAIIQLACKTVAHCVEPDYCTQISYLGHRIKLGTVHTTCSLFIFIKMLHNSVRQDLSLEQS